MQISMAFNLRNLRFLSRTSSQRCSRCFADIAKISDLGFGFAETAGSRKKQRKPADKPKPQQQRKSLLAADGFDGSAKRASKRPGDVFGTIADQLDPATNREQKLQMRDVFRNSRTRERQSEREAAEDLGSSSGSDDDTEEVVALRVRPFENPEQWYATELRKLADNGKIAESVALLEKRMIAENACEPDHRHYVIVIGALAKEGYARKAFEVYDSMCKRKIDASSATYTSLWNACANSPHAKAGLDLGFQLLRKVDAMGYPLSRLNYHAILKLLSRHGTMADALEIVRRLKTDGWPLNAETFGHLLHICIGNQQNGFAQAVVVWRDMLRAGEAPTTFEYNLLLRVCRDCGVAGEGQFGSGGHMPLTSSLVALSPVDVPRLEPGGRLPQQPPTVDEAVCEQERPLVGRPPIVICDLGSSSANKKAAVIALRDPMLANPFIARQRDVEDLPAFTDNDELDFSTAEGRFALFGGLQGFLSAMTADKQPPDIRTFAQMLDLIAADTESEEKLMRKMAAYEVNIDTSFVNALIRRRATRGEIQLARDTVKMLRERRLNPNEHTFGSLARCHLSFTDGLQLLDDMKKLGMTPGIRVFSSLMTGALKGHPNFDYAKTIIHEMEKAGVAPTAQFVQQVDSQMSLALEKICQPDSEAGGGQSERVGQQAYLRLHKYWHEWTRTTKLEQKPRVWASLDKAIDAVDTDIVTEDDASLHKKMRTTVRYR